MSWWRPLRINNPLAQYLCPSRHFLLILQKEIATHIYSIKRAVIIIAKLITFQAIKTPQPTPPSSYSIKDHETGPDNKSCSFTIGPSGPHDVGNLRKRMNYSHINNCVHKRTTNVYMPLPTFDALLFYSCIYIMLDSY